MFPLNVGTIGAGAHLPTGGLKESGTGHREASVQAVDSCADKRSNDNDNPHRLQQDLINFDIPFQGFGYAVSEFQRITAMASSDFRWRQVRIPQAVDASKSGKINRDESSRIVRAIDEKWQNNRDSSRYNPVRSGFVRHGSQGAK